MRERFSVYAVSASISFDRRNLLQSRWIKHFLIRSKTNGVKTIRRSKAIGEKTIRLKPLGKIIVIFAKQLSVAYCASGYAYANYRTHFP